jgi:hypothetical protein
VIWWGYCGRARKDFEESHYRIQSNVLYNRCFYYIIYFYSLDVDTNELRKTRSAENVFCKPKIVIDHVSRLAMQRVFNDM